MRGGGIPPEKVFELLRKVFFVAVDCLFPFLLVKFRLAGRLYNKVQDGRFKNISLLMTFTTSSLSARPTPLNAASREGAGGRVAEAEC